MLFVVLGCFVAHTVEVWLYAGAFLAIYKSGLGSLQGQVEELRPGETWLTHLSHDYDAAKPMPELPANVALAWDGLRVSL